MFKANTVLGWRSHEYLVSGVFLQGDTIVVQFSIALNPDGIQHLKIQIATPPW